ncbi:MAG: hypothetical protein HY779_05910, partial [Rubrobacteridae bacterium]|nr:hypothetical protein [Rubrobacteridae bacterium]
MIRKAKDLGLRSILLLIALCVFSVALFFAVVASANQSGDLISASGIIRESGAAVSVPVSLGLLGSNERQKTGYSAPKRTALVVSKVFVKPGSYVKKGEAVLALDNAEAGYNLDLMKARYEVVQATIEQLTGSRSNLSDKEKELNNTEADIKIKQSEASRQFNEKYNQGKAKLDELRSRLTTVAGNLEKSKSALKNLNALELETNRKLEDLKKLPDSYSSKSSLILSVTNSLAGIKKQKTQLASAVAQLSAARSRLQNGIYTADSSLAKGKAQFTSGMKKMDDALAKICDGRQSIQDGKSSISKKLAVLLKRRDQADVGVLIAKKMVDDTKIKAGHSGLVKGIKINEGSVVFAGQPVAAITIPDKLLID